MRKQPKIFFLHIPKTAGLTMHAILENLYSGSRQHTVRQVALTSAYTTLSQKRKENIAVVKGHFLYGLHTHEENTTCLTFLREPIARTISGYNFICNYKGHPLHKMVTQNKISLFDFLDQKIAPNFDNMHVRFMCGNNTMPFGEVTQNHLELAMHNLQQRNVFFGLTNRFDESVVYFKHVLHWNWPCYQKTNVTATAHVLETTIDERTLRKIKETNVFDLELYTWAKHEFDKRLNSLGDSFQLAVSEFKSNNAQYTAPKKTWLQRLMQRKHDFPV